MRTTENKKMLASLPAEIPEGTDGQQLTQILLIIAKLLVDISKSQAVLADAAIAAKKERKQQKKGEQTHD